MKKFILPVILAFLASCGGSEDSSEEYNNSTNNDVETDSTESFSEELVPFRRSEKNKSNFTKDQLSPNKLWLYYTDSENLYPSDYMNNDSIIGQIKKGDFVEKLDDGMSFLINGQAIVGSPIKVRTADGTVGWVWDHYLVPMPPIKWKSKPQNLDFEWYLKANLHAGRTDSIIYEGAYHGETRSDWDDEWDRTTYYYEQGISYSVTSHYESTERVLMLRNMSISEGYLFLDAWAEGIGLMEITEGIPQSKYEEFQDMDYGRSYYEADIQFDEMFTIMSELKISLGDGCGKWFIVKEILNEGIQLTVGGGC